MTSCPDKIALEMIETIRSLFADYSENILIVEFWFGLINRNACERLVL